MGQGSGNGPVVRAHPKSPASIAAPTLPLMLLMTTLSAGCPDRSRTEAPAPRPTDAPSPPQPNEPPKSERSSSPPVTSTPAPVAPSTPIPDDMLGVPGGWFVMGQDRIGEKDEQPMHRVFVQPFLLDRTEVTNRAYYQCVDAKVCRRHSTTSATANKLGDDKRFRAPEQPISGISHDDATSYCTWLGRRLPREAEWERAARGSDGRLYPWGDSDPTHEHAVFQAGVTMPVGSKPQGAGPYGHLDLAGNVWEWVADRYDPYAYRRPTAAQGVPGSCDEILATQDELRKNGMEGFTGSNPIPDECEFVLRGGAFNYGGKGLRSSNRVHHPGRFRLVMSGFRCAMDWPGGPVENPDAGVPPASSTN